MLRHTVDKVEIIHVAHSYNIRYRGTMLKTEGREALLELLDQGWNQSRLARRIGVSQPAVCAWLAMRARPNVRTQLALQRAFGIPLSAWLTAEEEARPAFTVCDRL